MATQTTNYKLTKPATSDKYDVTVFNGNADKIDVQMKANADAVATKEPKITGAATTITGSNLTASRVVVSNASGKVAVSDITADELGYLDGATGNIQTQLNGKLPSSGTAVKATADASGNTITSTYATKNELSTKATELENKISNAGVKITGAATTIVSDNLTASRVLISDSTGKVAVSPVTSTEVGYLDGVTSAIQTQINAKPDKAGTGISISNGTINHSNSVTAQTSYVGSATAVPMIKFDAQGHITDVSTATIYPPTSAGTSGQVWVSDGDGAGTWKTLVTISKSSPSGGSDGDLWFVYQ